MLSHSFLKVMKVDVAMAAAVETIAVLVDGDDNSRKRDLNQQWISLERLCSASFGGRCVPGDGGLQSFVCMWVIGPGSAWARQSRNMSLPDYSELPLHCQYAVCTLWLCVQLYCFPSLLLFCLFLLGCTTYGAVRVCGGRLRFMPWLWWGCPRPHRVAVR